MLCTSYHRGTALSVGADRADLVLITCSSLSQCKVQDRHVPYHSARPCYQLYFGKSRDYLFVDHSYKKTVNYRFPIEESSCSDDHLGEMSTDLGLQNTFFKWLFLRSEVLLTESLSIWYSRSFIIILGYVRWRE